jgi:hypothetical protein
MSDLPELAASGEQPRRPLRVGSRVEVRNRFDGSWSPGFEVSALVDDGYRIRRRSDGSELPAEFDADDVRRERRTSMWWV